MPKNTFTYSALLTMASCVALTSGCAAHDDAAPDSEPTVADDVQEDDAMDAAGAGSIAANSDPAADFSPYFNECGEAIPLEPGDFEIVDPFDFDDVLIQTLPGITELGENVVLHARLGPAANPEMDESLIRVVGSKDAPVVMFSSDALVELGHLEESPGEGFFSAFAKLDMDSVEARFAAEKEMMQGEFDEMSLIFRGRSPVALTTASAFDIASLFEGALVNLGAVTIHPPSKQQNWGESVFITDPQVVSDPSRTYDTCTQKGDACGPWTFCHLMTEMANEPLTGISPEDFTQQWLEQWLDTYTVNGDSVDARAQMQQEIIEPWLAASGGDRLDLKKAPLRLLAIVPRLDLRRTSSGGGGYNGSGFGTPVDAGELRFVFGLMRPDEDGVACEPLPFTVIFEYGVPLSGCDAVSDWADQWVDLDLLGGFGSTYRHRLQDLTDQVVARNANPSKGNGSAINQIRTNENALDPTWELREFTLTDQITTSCGSFIDSPSNGMLRPHTVAQTPDDGTFMPTPDALVDQFIASNIANVPLDYDCSAPPSTPFLGGNSLASLNLSQSAPTQGSWFTSNSYSGVEDDRHDFSVNTCNGCHTCDTGTRFTHVDPMSPLGGPANLSGFLTGITVNDTQFPSIPRHFADLDRRYQDLYKVANALCGPVLAFEPELIEELQLPFDPVLDPGVVHELFTSREEFINFENTIDGPLGEIANEQAHMAH